jgi:hypothetical protein
LILVYESTKFKINLYTILRAIFDKFLKANFYKSKSRIVKYVFIGDVMHNKSCTLEHRLKRRDFLRLAVMTSAVLAHSAHMNGAELIGENNGNFAQLHPLPPGSVHPKGWLRNYLEKQAAQLGSKLTETSWPFTENYWAGEEKAESWWPWEQKAYWLDGAARLALVLDDEDLMHQVRASFEYTLSHPGNNGYLGPHFFELAKDDFSRWPQNVFFRGLSAISDSTEIHNSAKTDDIIRALRLHFINDKTDYGKPVRNVTNIEGMLWAYAHTGDLKLLTMAENAWSSYCKTTSNSSDPSDLSELRVYADTPINAHGVTYAETVKLPALLYIYTGKKEYLRFALAAQRRIFDNHMLIDGIPSTTEYFRTITSLDSHETCDIADHTWSWGYLLMATGSSVWADRIERACFNAAPGAIKPDWKALQYFSCPNQFLATHDSDHNVMEHGGYMMAYQPNPGQKTACCGGNVHRIFPNYVIRMWMKTNDGGLAAVLYGPSEVVSTVGNSKQAVKITQITDYPFRDQIKFIFKSDRIVEFPLWLRVPSWCVKPQLKVNGKTVSAVRNDQGFLVLGRIFKPNDCIVLTLPMKLALSHWPQNGIGIERGPLVYSFPIPAQWVSCQDVKFTTKEFPSWDATPTDSWNYGLAFNSRKIEDQVEVITRPGSIDDPWTHPSISLKVPAKKIPGWVLQTNPDKPEQKFTPTLPDLTENKPTPVLERITLVPYGTTQLRVTVFPDVSNLQNLDRK